ncbi:Multiple epidermal growth factor-like domains protein 6 [Labeo rohita]|uniref:Multiple epidermal growth factor-like domains protein 6 n=1 Tax=Labeo rohita TaxID=84645 RepID=A0ABQ8LGG5_LABRO|nr:Multiple epidermal growth factor-like domains protein 6 [Labeo rohita]
MKQPCVQAFTRMVKVWRQGCTGHAWCMDYERRTVYFIGYRQVYRQDFKTTYRCCPGWSQLNAEAGCLYPLCTYGVCFNGGVCTGHLHQLCDCTPGFNGSNCQHEYMLSSQRASHFHYCVLWTFSVSSFCFTHFDLQHFHWFRIEQPPGASVEHNHSKVTAGLMEHLNPFSYTVGSVFPYGTSVKSNDCFGLTNLSRWSVFLSRSAALWRLRVMQPKSLQDL